VIEKVQKQTFITTLFLEKVMKDSEDIQRLIRLKKYETPGDEYFQNFLEDFKDRQRGEMLQQSARGLLFERVTMWFDDLSGPRWLVPAGATAAAAIALGIYAIRPVSSENGVPGTGIASITENSLPLASPDTATSNAIPPIDEQVISLQLPRPDQRVPGLGNSGRPEVQGLLPASARAIYREL
jgi:hypothetical protein